ncbi:MAG: hypothetical protein GY952_14175 [Rhodobacteraceae bacterium]|nr:hypothetical protein [Paracoccaceae bacterium]
MAAITYTILTGTKSTEDSIKYWLNWGKAPSAAILRNAESWIYQFLRVREMRVRKTGTIAADDTTITLPTGYVEHIQLMLTGSHQCKITMLDEELFELNLAYDGATVNLVAGTPTYFTTDGTLAYLNTKAAEAYTYAWWHYATPTALSGSNETNFLTTRYPALLQAACLYWANMFRKDEAEAERWSNIAMGLIGQAQVEVDRERRNIEHQVHWDGD